MNSLHNVIVQLMGSAPVGYEVFEYIFTGCIAIMFFKAVLMFFSIPFKSMKL